MSIVVRHPFGSSAAILRSLNCDDLPEVNVWPLGRKARSSKIAKPRQNRVDLPVVTEAPYEDSDPENTEEQPMTSWRCHSCTFLNNALLPCCEVCEVQRTDVGAMRAQALVEATSNGDFVGSTPSLDWPALPDAQPAMAESWIDCDVSSVASSWLDIGFACEKLGDADEADIVLIPQSSPFGQAPKLAEAPLWSAVVGRAVASEVHLSAVVVPPLSRTVAVKTRAPPVIEDDRDIDLDELDAKRTIGVRRRNHLRVKRR